MKTSPDGIIREINERGPATDLYDVWDDATKALHDLAALFPDEMRDEARDLVKQYMDLTGEPLQRVVQADVRNTLRGYGSQSGER